MVKENYVYILTNAARTVLYTGVTNDLKRRVYEHKGKIVDGFTRRYNVDQLVYFEAFGDVRDAIEWEKRIKAGSRLKKMELIMEQNQLWQDLYDDL